MKGNTDSSHILITSPIFLSHKLGSSVQKERGTAIRELGGPDLLELGDSIITFSSSLEGALTHPQHFVPSRAG
jgi:hypothetical protein